MSADVQNLRRRLQELHELHATGFVDDAQHAESQALLERWLVDAVMKEEATTAASAPQAPEPDVAASALAAESPAAKPPKAALRWPLWLGAAALVHAGAIGAYWWLSADRSSDALAAKPAAETASARRTSGAVAPPASSAGPVEASNPLAGAPSAVASATPTFAASAVARASGGSVASTHASGGGIVGTIALSPAIASLARPGDTLFVYAKAVDGPPMPLAVIRKQVKDLPLSFTLDDSMAMWPAAKVSAFSRVVVTARVSRSGEGKAQIGDLEGHSPPVAAGTAGLLIEIGSVVSH